MKKGIAFTFMMLLVVTSLLAQKQNNIWCFGYGAGINFNSGSPVSFSGVALDQTEGTSSIADANGNLLFYTDGITVWNKNNLAMPNGTGLLGNSSSTQSGLIVKQPGNTNIYYVFSTDADQGPNGFNYSIVDMNLQSGLGDVTIKNVNILPVCDERVMALTNCNQNDIWIITTTDYLDTIKAYHLTASGFNNTPVVSATGIVHSTSDVFIGYLKPSPSGNKLAVAYFYGGFDIYDFDRSTGLVSNPISIQSATYWSAYGVEFSPDGNLLYGVGDGATQIYQFNLALGTQSAISSSVVTVGNSSDGSLGSLQLAPDGKIYLARDGSPYLGVIDSPNVLGTGCNYVDLGFYLNYGESSIGLPNMLHTIGGGLPPTVNFSANDTAICPGSPVNFTSLADSTISYSWSFPGGSPDTSTSQNPANILYQQTGYYSVQLIASANCATDTVVMNNYIHVQSPVFNGSITAQPDTVCTSNFSQLTVTVSSDSIQWQSSTDMITYTNIPEADSLIYTTPALTQTTDYRVVAKSGTCSDTSAPITILVNPLPLPLLHTNDSLICSSDSTEITATPGYASYMWNNGSTSDSISVNAGGGYWVTVTGTNGCSAVSGNQYISVYPVPSVSIVVQGDTLSSFGAVSYQWYFNNTPIPNATGLEYIATQSGDYGVQVTDTNGCKALSNNIQVVVTNVSQINGPGELTIYPNPFTNTIFVSATANIGSIELYDVLGRMVYNKNQSHTDARTFTIDASTLAGGIYYLHITTDVRDYTQKIVKL